MEQKLVVITGANTGIGLETARGLYADGHNIIFGSRSEQKNSSAIQSITQSFPNSMGKIRYFPLDLSKRASV
jgi:retinol dehydrogenase-12/retinol dehydrogenase-13